MRTSLLCLTLFFSQSSSALFFVSPPPLHLSMPPRRISTKPKAGPPRAKRPEAPKGKKKKKPRPGEGGRTLFVTIAAAGAATIIGVALKSLLTSLAATKKSADALARAASKPLYFTQHARERMECRHVSERQVKEALSSGTVVGRKSELGGGSAGGKGKRSGVSFGGVCDKLVVDADIPGDDESGEPFKALQAVFKACDADTGVITVIDRVRFFLLFSFFLFHFLSLSLFSSLCFFSLCSLPLSFSLFLSLSFSLLPAPHFEKKNRPPTGSARANLLNSDVSDRREHKY